VKTEILKDSTSLAELYYSTLLSNEHNNMELGFKLEEAIAWRLCEFQGISLCDLKLFKLPSVMDIDIRLQLNLNLRGLSKKNLSVFEEPSHADCSNCRRQIHYSKANKQMIWKMMMFR
jgi:hypothetical protein